uniref:Late blight resistance protein n=1 Tax=Solanum tuberosum TaxID=4113 RepID=M1D5I4_SOLTU
MKIDPSECKEAHWLTVNCSLDQRCAEMPILVTYVYIIRRCRPTGISTLNVSMRIGMLKQHRLERI